MRLWALWQQRCAIPLDAGNFFQEPLDWGIDRLAFEERCAKSDSSDVVEPDKLNKIGYELWRTFWRQLKDYCSTKRGAMKIPISYVLRDHDEPDAEIMATEYADSDENLMMKVALTGPDYLYDNKTVWGILTRVVGYGTAWAYIKPLERTFNARAAIKILKAQSEGTSSDSNRMAEANKILRTVKYDGKTSRFDFQAFTAKLQFAFTELTDCGIVIAESQKVDYLLAGCRNSSAKETFATINRDNGLMNDYQECCSYIKSHLSKSTVYSESEGSKRSAAAVGTSDQLKFTDEEWYALSSEEKASVQKKRQAAKKKKQSGGAGGGGTTTNTTPSSKSLAKLRKRIAALETGTSAEPEASEDEEIPMKAPASKKQKK